MQLRTIYERLVRERLAFVSLIYLILLLFVALFASVLVPFDPAEQDLNHIMNPPSGLHWFGTDELGRDIFSRLLMGAQAAIQAGSIAILIPFFVGVPVRNHLGLFGWSSR